AVARVLARPRPVTDVHGAERYIRSAVRTAFLDALRSAGRRDAKVHLVAVPEIAPVRTEQRAGTTVDVRAALDGLPPRERACVVLRHFDDLPVAVIAAELGISEGTVKKYLADGAARLRAVLGDVVEAVDDGTAPVREAR